LTFTSRNRKSARDKLLVDGPSGSRRLPPGRSSPSGGRAVYSHALQVSLHVARRLSKPLLVLDQRDADIAFTVLAVADAGRDSDFGMRQQLLGELEATHVLQRRRKRGPCEHRGGRGGDVPAGASERLDQHVAPLVVKFSVLVDAVLGTVEGGAGGCLERGEGAV